MLKILKYLILVTTVSLGYASDNINNIYNNQTGSDRVAIQIITNSEIKKRKPAYKKEDYKQNIEVIINKMEKEYSENIDKTVTEFEKDHNKNEQKTVARMKKYCDENMAQIITEIKNCYKQKENILAVKRKYGRKYYNENREKIFKITKTKYHWTTMEKIIISHKKYYNKNRDKIIARTKNYYNKNREKILKRQKEYDDTHRGKINQYMRKYMEKYMKEYNRYKQEAICKYINEHSEIQKIGINKLLQDNNVKQYVIEYMRSKRESNNVNKDLKNIEGINNNQISPLLSENSNEDNYINIENNSINKTSENITNNNNQIQITLSEDESQDGLNYNMLSLGLVPMPSLEEEN